MSSIALYVETDGQADNPEQAIAEAAVSPDSVPFDEGDVVEVKIEATWTTPDGKHHAKVSLVKQTKHTPDESGLSKRADNVNTPFADNTDAPPPETVETTDIEVAHDGLTDDDPTNLESSALENTRNMKDAEEELEYDFDEAQDPNSKRNRDLEDKPESDYDPEQEEDGYNNEGLRRVDSGNKKFKPED